MSVNGALLRFTYPPNLLGRGVGLNALVVSAAAAFGPTVASGVLALGPWEWLFAINVPIGVVAFVIGRKSLPANPKEGRFDIVSTCLNVLTFGLGFTGIDALTRGGDAWFGFGGARAGGARRRRFDMAIQCPAETFGADRPSEKQAVRDVGRDVDRLVQRANVGLRFVALLLARRPAPEPGRDRAPDDALACRRWRRGVHRGSTGGQVSRGDPQCGGAYDIGFGLLSMGLLPAETTSLAIAGLMAICGLGFGFFQSPNNRTMLSAAPLRRSGAAGGMLATSRLIGQTTGATIAAIAFRFATHAELIALVIAALFAFVAALASLSRLRYGNPSRGPNASRFLLRRKPPIEGLV